jgi:hypothetical protein
MPIVPAAGIPLFADRAELGRLRLREHQVYSNGVVSLIYVKP